MFLSLIVAYDKNRAIGKNNALPWHLPADLKHFKAKTLGKPIIMGRKTFESIGKPLPGRANIVISRDKTFYDCDNFRSLEAALAAYKEDKEVIIIGGAQLFTQALPLVKKMYITEIDAICEGDTFFPEIDKTHWKIISEEKNLPDEKNVYPYTFQTWVRKS